jgi:hypothetical protein
MGQLEVYNINETILNGLMLSIFITYLSESLESTTFESFKVYAYSSNFSTSKKTTKIAVTNLLAITPDNAIFNSWNYFDFTNRTVIRMTKLIDDFLIWQDLTTVDFKVDENVIKLQRKYNLE